MNAKNGFGAYVGFEPFYYADGQAVLVSSDPDRFSELTNRCFRTTSKSSDDKVATNNASGAKPDLNDLLAEGERLQGYAKELEEAEKSQ